MIKVPEMFGRSRSGANDEEGSATEGDLKRRLAGLELDGLGGKEQRFGLLEL